jgi:hypothetical protein
MWLKTRSSEGLFWVRYWILGFHEVWIGFQITKDVSCWQEWLFHGVACEMAFVFSRRSATRNLYEFLRLSVRATCPTQRHSPIEFWYSPERMFSFRWSIHALLVWVLCGASCSGSNAGNSCWPGKFFSSTAYSCSMLPVGSRNRFTLVI